MAKYTQEVKDKAVEAAKNGMALKAIQTEIGPNPKATLRYLAKAGIDYNALKEELKEAGKLQGVTKKQEKSKSNKSKKSKKAESDFEEIIVEE